MAVFLRSQNRYEMSYLFFLVGKKRWNFYLKFGLLYSLFCHTMTLRRCLSSVNYFIIYLKKMLVLSKNCLIQGCYFPVLIFRNTLETPVCLLQDNLPTSWIKILKKMYFLRLKKSLWIGLFLVFCRFVFGVTCLFAAEATIPLTFVCFVRELTSVIEPFPIT